MEIVFLLLPTIVCFIVAATVWTRSNLTLSSRLLAWTMVACGIYLFLSALTTFPYTEPQVVVWCAIGLGLMVPLVQLLVLLLGWSLHTQKQRFNSTMYLFALLPFLSGFLMMIGYGLIGIDAAADYIECGRMLPPNLSPGEVMMYNAFHFITFNIYQFIVIISICSCTGYLIYLMVASDFTLVALYRFLFCKGPLRPLHLFILIYLSFSVLSVIRLSGDRIYVRNHIDLYCVLFTGQSVILSLFAFVAARFHRPCIYLVRPHRTPHYEDLPVHVRPLSELEGEYQFADDESDSYRTLNLRDELKVVMREKACYLSPGMSRYCVSQYLDISRAGLDRLVHLLYRVNYEEYVMIQRTEYYRRYRLQFPGESQECVAMACGFQNVKEMNRQIKACRAFFQPIPEGVVTARRQRR